VWLRCPICRERIATPFVHSEVPIINVHFTQRRGTACELVIFPAQHRADQIPRGMPYDQALERAVVAA
jgi:hypothetical protein